MDLPLSSTDIRIAITCRVCSGNGGFGMRKADSGSGGRPAASPNFQPCTTCSGNGWELKKPGDLTEQEHKRLLTKLPTPPATPTPPIDLARMANDLDHYMHWSETWHRQAGGYTASDTGLVIESMDRWATRIKEITGHPETSLRRKHHA